MDVLTRLFPTTGQRAFAAFSLLLVTVTACLALGQPAGGPHFSHAVHVDEQKLDCVFCHGTADSAAAAGMPPQQICMPCHDKVDADKLPSRRLANFYREDGHFDASPVATLPGDVRFSHRSHVGDQGLACDACHGNAGHSERIPAESAVTKDECMTCHAERGKSNACATCHAAIDTDWRPPTHDGLWEVHHGRVARLPSSASVDRCELCHSEGTSCNACHQEVAPRDHTHFWRLRGHGVAVALDRSRCTTCHRRDFCDRCHQDTRPIGHLGGFGSPQNRHCTNCHFPASSSGCTTCHKGPSSHLQATPLPPGHRLGMNCRACHGAGQPLPHHDPGTSCIACHR